MPKSLPAVDAKFADETKRSLEVVAATEALWLTAPPASDVRKQLKVAQLEALYESVFLRIFAAWEDLQEQLVVYQLAGYRSQGYTPNLVSGSASRTLKEARAVLYAGKDYLLWHNPDAVEKRVNKVLNNSPVATVVSSVQTELEAFAAVRHAVAHGSTDAKQNFHKASFAICGYQHTKVGKFLRAEDFTDPLNPMKWILVVRNRLVALAQQMSR